MIFIIKRIITALVGILILIPLCIFSNTYAWPIGVTFFEMFAMYEIVKCVGFEKDKKMLVPALLLGFMPIAVWFMANIGITKHHSIFFCAIAFVFVICLLSVIFNYSKKMEKVCAYMFLTLYIAIGFTAFMLMRKLPHGKYMMVVSFLIPWATDTFAMFGGKLFGKHKLAPNISPKKTVEGSISGIVFSTLAVAVYCFIINKLYNASADIVFFAVLGVILSVISQIGDLFMSLVKRHYGVKDFGFLFPGHGGCIDRFDSVIAVSLAMFFMNSFIQF